MGSSDLFRGTGVQVGPIFLAEPVLTTWGIMVALIAGSWIVTRRLSLDPGPVQVVLEGLLNAADDAIRAVLPVQTTQTSPIYRHSVVIHHGGQPLWSDSWCLCPDWQPLDDCGIGRARVSSRSTGSASVQKESERICVTTWPRCR